jgi:hypothetical protein
MIDPVVVSLQIRRVLNNANASIYRNPHCESDDLDPRVILTMPARADQYTPGIIRFVSCM